MDFGSTSVLAGITTLIQNFSTKDGIIQAILTYAERLSF